MRTGELVIQQDLVTADDALFERRVDIVMSAIETASEVDSPPPLNLFTGPARWNPKVPVVGRDITYSAAWSRILKGYEAFVTRAEALGVDLAVEGVWGMICHNFFTTHYLIETFDSPRLGVNYDPSHDVLVGIEDVSWVIRQWAARKRIKHVHLKDAAGTADGERFLFPMLGEGRVDWRAFFKALHETGYEGYMSVEFEVVPLLRHCARRRSRKRRDDFDGANSSPLCSASRAGERRRGGSRDIAGLTTIAFESATKVRVVNQSANQLQPKSLCCKCDSGQRR